jgi:hypothetical protein
LARASSLDGGARGALAGDPERDSRRTARPRAAYHFTHELVRRAIYDRINGLRRAELQRFAD